MTASTALFFTIIEVLFLRLGIYLLPISGQEAGAAMMDLIAYTGYKFVSIICIQLTSLFVAGGWIKFAVFVYCSSALGWFMVCVRFYRRS
jgi:hypothetical protein